MVATGMAKTRRPAHFVERAVLRLLANQVRPPSGLQLAEMMRGEGDIVPLSQMYRTLRLLADSGSIRKVHLASGYIVTGNTAAIDLYCQSCGILAVIATTEVVEYLSRVAAIADFKASRFIVEISGICHNCHKMGKIG